MFYKPLLLRWLSVNQINTSVQFVRVCMRVHACIRGSATACFRMLWKYEHVVMMTLGLSLNVQHGFVFYLSWSAKDHGFVTVTILDVIQRHVVYLEKHDVSETGFCLFLQVETTRMTQ
jgi:hypothetical protein